MIFPSFFYTAYGSHELMMEVAKYGAFDFLRKPDFQGLEEVVARGLEEGFKRKNPTHGAETDALMSEYQRMLEDIDKDII